MTAMKVLHLPNNIASTPAITVDALNRVEGIEAKGIFLNPHPYLTPKANCITYNIKTGNFFLNYYNFFKWYLKFLKLLRWADVIHWTGSFNNTLLYITLPVIKWMKKPALVEWVGDIRIPEVEFADNPYYKEIHYDPGFEYTYHSIKHSRFIQTMFKKNGFELIQMPGMEQYFLKDLNFKSYKVFHRIIADDFQPRYPSSTNKKPLIIHTPTAPVTKGTKYILLAIENLKKKYDFTFELIQNMPHEQTLEKIMNTDIMIDQIILGSYGMAAMEGMAYGKPVICFIKDRVARESFPPELPLVNANPDTIEKVLESLIIDSQKRHDIGVNGRKYIENYHDVKVVIPALISAYEKTIQSHKNH